MLVSKQDLSQTINNIESGEAFGLDTETYGLLWHHRLFSLQIACSATEVYYFNFYAGEDYLGNKVDSLFILDKKVVFPLLQKVFNDPNKTWFAHNATFDLNMLAKEGCQIRGKVHCTKAIERLIKNDLFQLKGWGTPYSLASLAKRRGMEKSEAVEEVISKNKLWSWVTLQGKKKREKDIFYYKVPIHTLVEYGEKDAVLAFEIGRDQEKQLIKLNAAFREAPDLSAVVDNEQQITKVIQQMGATGIKIDRSYVLSALAYEEEELKKAKKNLEELAGIPLTETHFLKKAFDKAGYHYDINEETENPIFDKEHLDSYDNPIAKAVREVRLHEKYISSFYSSFLYYADSDDVIHAGADQSGTTSGRLSYREPNLQNVPKEEEFEDKKFIVRKCFIPRKDYAFLFIDFSQQEFRLALDYAGEEELIEEINKGKDVHQATADMVGITRKQAKTLNFATLYGSGAEKISKFLHISVDEAVELKNKYFASMPKLKHFLYNAAKIAKQRGIVWNRYGRLYHLRSTDEAYIIPNNLIQGTAADVCKFAMVKLHNYLEGKKSRMLVQVHDEILFEIHKDELNIQVDLKKIMEDEYQPKNGMKLTCSVEHSLISWGSCDKKEGFIT